MAYCQYLLKAPKKIVDECKMVVPEIQPDSRDLRHMYAILVFLTLTLAYFGTFQEASAYYQKMKDAEKRQIELYGEQGVQLESRSCWVNEAHSNFRNLTNGKIRDRVHLDQVKGQNQQVMDALEQDATEMPEDITKRQCTICEKGSSQGVKKVFACSRCKLVCYCSKECQKFDWKNHKKACKLYATTNPK